MSILALFFAIVSGALIAALICKAIRLKLWVDMIAGAGGLSALYVAIVFAGTASWPLFGLPVGFVAVVGYLRRWAT